MKAGQILDVTLRSMRVVDVKPGSTLLVGSLPNGEPFEVRVPFDADVRTTPVERTVQCASTLADPEWGDHRCVLYVDAGPHTDCRHICDCGKQWDGRA